MANIAAHPTGPAFRNRHRAFESFVQLDTLGDNKGGFGLGLAIVKRAVEWHSGKVVIVQSPLGGVRVAAIWPVTTPAT
jgi:two-component system sensor histidine kinase RstB